MKRTHDVNIGGTIFHIEEDAYGRLDAYLSAIGARFASYPDNADIIADIEGRIAEQLLQTNAASRIVMIGDVERVIAVMGRADQLGEGGDAEPSTSAPAPVSGVRGRRLFRDPDGKVIAGVAKGLATYTGHTLVFVRTLFVVPLLLGLLALLVEGGGFHSWSFTWILAWDFWLALLDGFVYFLLWLISEPLTSVPALASGVRGWRFVRDPNGRIIAGIAKGFAMSHGHNLMVVRALFMAPWLLGLLGLLALFVPPFTFLMVILSGFVYLLLWFIIPMATKTTDKLLMLGNPVTLVTVEQSVRDRVVMLAPVARSFSTTVITAIGSVIRLFVVGVAWAIGIVAVGATVLGVLWCTVLLVIMLVNMHAMDDVFPINFLTQLHACYWPFILCSYFIIAIPLSCTALIAVAAFRKRYRALTRTVIVLASIWLVSLFVWAGIWATYYPLAAGRL